MTAFDLLAGAMFALAIGFGFARGAAKGLFGLLALIGAAILSLYAHPLLRHLAEGFTEKDWLAGALGLIIGFCVFYAALWLIGAWLRRGLKEGAVGALDRLAGAGLGAMRVILILGLFNLAFTAVTPGNSGPHWVKAAKIYPLTQASARILRFLAPRALSAAGNLRKGMEKGDESVYDDPTTTRSPQTR